MRTTIDQYTGKAFRWNTTVTVDYDGSRVDVPAHETSRESTHLHPNRVDPALLARLQVARQRAADAEKRRYIGALPTIVAPVVAAREAARDAVLAAPGNEWRASIGLPPIEVPS